MTNKSKTVQDLTARLQEKESRFQELQARMRCERQLTAMAQQALDSQRESYDFRTNALLEGIGEWKAIAESNKAYGDAQYDLHMVQVGCSVNLGTICHKLADSLATAIANNLDLEDKLKHKESVIRRYQAAARLGVSYHDTVDPENPPEMDSELVQEYFSGPREPLWKYIPRGLVCLVYNGSWPDRKGGGVPSTYQFTVLDSAEAFREEVQGTTLEPGLTDHTQAARSEYRAKLVADGHSNTVLDIWDSKSTAEQDSILETLTMGEAYQRRADFREKMSMVERPECALALWDSLSPEVQDVANPIPATIQTPAPAAAVRNLSSALTNLVQRLTGVLLPAGS